MERNQGSSGAVVRGLPWVGVGGDGLPEWSVKNRGAAYYLLWTFLYTRTPLPSIRTLSTGTPTPGLSMVLSLIWVCV